MENKIKKYRELLTHGTEEINGYNDEEFQDNLTLLQNKYVIEAGDITLTEIQDYYSKIKLLDNIIRTKILMRTINKIIGDINGRKSE